MLMGGSVRVVGDWRCVSDFGLMGRKEACRLLSVLLLLCVFNLRKARCAAGCLYVRSRKDGARVEYVGLLSVIRRIVCGVIAISCGEGVELRLAHSEICCVQGSDRGL